MENIQERMQEKKSYNHTHTHDLFIECIMFKNSKSVVQESITDQHKSYDGRHVEQIALVTQVTCKSY